MMGGEIFKLRAPLGQWLVRKSAIPGFQQIERKKQGWRFYGQFFYTAVGRMNALQKVIKGKLATDGNDDFAIKDEASFAQRRCGGSDLRKITGQILARF